MLKERAKKVTQSARRTRKGFFQHLQIIMLWNYHLKLKTESILINNIKVGMSGWQTSPQCVLTLRYTGYFRSFRHNTCSSNTIEIFKHFFDLGHG